MTTEDQSNDAWQPLETRSDGSTLIQLIGPDDKRPWAWIILTPEPEPKQDRFDFDDDDLDEEYRPITCPFCNLSNRDACEHLIDQCDDGIAASGGGPDDDGITGLYFKVAKPLSTDELDEDERNAVWEHLDQASLNPMTKSLIEVGLHGDESDYFYADFLSELGIIEEAQAWEGMCISGSWRAYFHPDPPTLFALLDKIAAEALPWIEREVQQAAQDRLAAWEDRYGTSASPTPS